jgi:TatD DNase family protein
MKKPFPLFDPHAHYLDAAFEYDRYTLLDNLFGSGEICGIVEAGTNALSSRAAAELATRYGNLWFAAGVHPSDITGNISDLDALLLLLDNPKCVAVGEVGLDYHYDNGAPRETQLKWFDAQLSLAEERGLPVIVHSRDAHGDTADILRAHKNVRCVLHSYSGSLELMREYVRDGRYISFSGVITFKNASKILDCVRAVPEGQLLIETDCPYLTPHPYRGKRNDSGYLRLTAAAAAELRGADPDALAALTVQNAKEFFGIK